MTKTWANARLQGPDAVQTMLKYLERKLGGRRISVGAMKRSSLMDLLDAGLVIEEQVSSDDLPRPRSAVQHQQEQEKNVQSLPFLFFQPAQSAPIGSTTSTVCV